MELTILDGKFNIVLEGITPEDAAKHLDCNISSIYRASCDGRKVRGCYITRSDDLTAVNVVLLRKIGATMAGKYKEDVNRTLVKYLQVIEGLDHGQS